MIGADYYESEEQRAALLAAGQVPLGMGPNSHLENAIADKNVRIGANCKIVNKEGVQVGTSSQLPTGCAMQAHA
jgi:glucose-1-phosphate adenylyltransferase